ncbi:transposase family protein [Ramlibacter sp. G-1-2-2]|uniref:Transposase family protein n=1 Tax=Ramlibacter agri TaxID=2728837 RepID=A0A848H2R3_9BURK|nr:transposase family protein [Ramlibacter agri]
MHSSLQAEEVSRALKMALRQRLVHHSDRGLQYCSAPYQSIHRRHRITCSMTYGYDCYQNALAERVSGILKMELLLRRSANLQQATAMVRESISIYNEERPHNSLDDKMPDAVHRASLAAQKRREFSPV